MDQNKCVDYFIINGKRYYTGTEFKIKYMGEVVDAVFVCTQFAKRTEIVYRINGRQYFTPIPLFEKAFVSISNSVSNETQMPQVKYMKDRDVQYVSVGWMWYIALMLFGVIVKGTLIWWIFISVVFFSWRANKIKEEGSYIEW